MNALRRAIQSAAWIAMPLGALAFGLAGCGAVTLPSGGSVGIDELVVVPPERTAVVEVGAPIILEARTHRDSDLRGEVTYEWQAPRDLDVAVEVSSPTSDYATLRARQAGSGIVTARVKLDGVVKDAKDIFLEVRPASTTKAEAPTAARPPERTSAPATSTPAAVSAAASPTPGPSAAPSATPTAASGAVAAAQCGASPRPRLGAAPSGDLRLRLVSPPSAKTTAVPAVEVDFAGEWAGLGDRDVFVFTYSYLDTKYWPTLRAGYQGSGDAQKAADGTFKGQAVIAAPETCYELVPVVAGDQKANQLLRDLVARTVVEGPSRNYPGLTAQELKAVGPLVEGEGATVIRRR